MLLVWKCGHRRFYLAYHTLPNSVHYILIFKFVKNTVAAQRYKIVSVLIQFEFTNIRISNNNFWITKQGRNLCFNISKRSANTESARENSVWTQYYLSLSTLSNHWGILIDLSTTFQNSVNFYWVSWFVIIWKCDYLFTSLRRENSPTVTRIANITNIIDY